MKKILSSTISLFLCLILLSSCISAFASYSTTSITGTYNQTSARELIEELSKLRQSQEDAFYYRNATDKVYKTGLSSLTYDCGVENAAMKRAAELSYSFSSERPNGEDGISIISESGKTFKSMKEIIAKGYSSIDDVLEYWLEDDGDYSIYTEERRMIFDSTVSNASAAHAIINGEDYWVVELFTPNTESEDTEAYNGSKTYDISIHTHDYGLPSDTKGATCYEQGYDIYVCSECKKTKTVVIPKLVHNFVKVTTSEATCTKEGSWQMQCTRCNTIDGSAYSIAKLSHVPLPDGQWNNLHTEYEYTCSTCNQNYKLTYNSGDEDNCIKIDTVVDENDSTGEITDTYTAIYNSNEIAKYIYKHHDYSDKEKIEFNWSDDLSSATATTQCKYDSKEETVDAQVNSKITKEATCTELGVIEHTAFAIFSDGSAYSDIRTSSISTTAHNYKLKTIKPTCTTQGYDLYTCETCNHSYKEKFTSTINHNWDTGVITLQPTTTTTGTKKYTCTVCGKTKTETLAKLTVSQATPSNTQANNAKVTKSIAQIANIKTTSYFNKKQMNITFAQVKGAQNYRIAYRKAGAKSWTYAWTNCKTTYILKNLKTKGLYEFKFAAYKKNANNIWERGSYSKTSYRYYYKESIKSVSPLKSSFKVTWTKDSNATGYLIQYSTKSDMSNATKITISGNNTTSKTIKNLKRGKKYYVRVRALKKKNTHTYSGEYSSKKAVTTK